MGRVRFDKYWNSGGAPWSPQGVRPGDPVFRAVVALAVLGGLVWTLVSPLWDGGGFVTWILSWIVSTAVSLLVLALVAFGLALAVILAIPATIWIGFAHTVWLLAAIPACVVLLGGAAYLSKRWEEADRGD